MDRAFDGSSFGGCGVVDIAERPLWAHQAKVIPVAVDAKRYGLFHQMGTGKTFTSIQILREWFRREGRVMKTLILGPPIVVENWSRELKAFTKVGKRVFTLTGTGKQRVDSFKKNSDAPNIFVTNYESILVKDLYAEILKWEPEVIIFDESHRLKNPKAKRTKHATVLADYAKRKLILTGSPILNSPMDLFAQIRLLDGGKLLGKSFFVFRATYFYDLNANMPSQKHFPKWVIRPGASEELEQKISGISNVVKKEDCLDLPPLVRKTVFVPLSPSQRKIYDSLKKDFVAYMGEKSCATDLAITKALRMQQVISGYVPMKDDSSTEIVEFADIPRLEALKEILEEITVDEKVLVWAVWRQNYEAIASVCKGLGLRYVECHGAISAKEKQAAIDEFNSDPEIKVFIGNPGSAGIGINLTVAAYSVFYSRNFSLEQDLQAEARNHRGGSERHKKITRIDIVAQNTLDEQIMHALAGKFSMSAEMLRNMTKEI